jgi:hypothetical protein
VRGRVCTSHLRCGNAARWPWAGPTWAAGGRTWRLLPAVAANGAHPLGAAAACCRDHTPCGRLRSPLLLSVLERTPSQPHWPLSHLACLGSCDLGRSPPASWDGVQRLPCHSSCSDAVYRAGRPAEQARYERLLDCRCMEGGSVGKRLPNHSPADASSARHLPSRPACPAAMPRRPALRTVPDATPAARPAAAATASSVGGARGAYAVSVEQSMMVSSHHLHRSVQLSLLHCRAAARARH